MSHQPNNFAPSLMSATNKILRVAINQSSICVVLGKRASFKYCLLPQMFVKPYITHKENEFKIDSIPIPKNAL